MESINLVKGYGKVSTIPAHIPPSHNPKLSATHRRKTAVLSLVILISLLVVTTIAVLIHKSTTSHKSKTNSTTPPSQSLSLNATESTRLVCSVTQYPNSCFSSISSLKNLPPQLSPQLVFTLSLKISLSELKNVSVFPKTLISKSNEANTVSALRDCASLFDDAVSQLNNSVASVADGSDKEVLTEAEIADVNSWISAAMTDQETCFDGLEEMESSVLDEVKSKVQMSKECMSNSLAILANMHSLVDKFGQIHH
ncbi:pectinesterase 1-like [Apium graveolens]|uniref:pectinesterase 1-like n=1 Tax=Apium graveolens TaxID=4045 RepID=UPI003D7B5640